MAFWDAAKSETIYPWNPTPGPGQRNDVSIPLKQDTQVQAPVSGVVLPQHPGGGGLYSYYGKQPWGGEVDILTNLSDYGGPQVVQLLHMDSIGVVPGQLVKKGDVLGLSGGQTSGGNMPSSPQYSTGPHVGLAVHSVSSWNQMSNPQQLLSNLLAGKDTSSTPTQAQIVGLGIGSAIGPIIGSINTPGAPDVAGSIGGAIWGNIQQQFGATFSWLSDPLRILKLLLGVALAAGGFLLFLLGSLGPDIGAAAVTAAGVPEAAGPVRDALSGRLGNQRTARAGIRTVGAIQGQKALKRRQAQGHRQGREEHRQIFVQAGRRGGQKAAANRRARKAAEAQQPPTEHEQAEAERQRILEAREKRRKSYEQQGGIDDTLRDLRGEK